jgi:nitroimidazol reductase NimA-like FMN-containing flavoprotein (pyridoxamine 5'-phosphate oxidase superfamily)
MVETTIEMDREAVDQFLESSGTGVISLSTTGQEPPHSVPVSYGYDDEEGTFYFRLAVGPDSEKGELAGRPATFVTYDTVEDRWQSVVARGRLSDIEEDQPQEALAGLERVHIPLVDIFGQQPGIVEFEFLRLVPDELTGRKEESSRA